MEGDSFIQCEDDNTIINIMDRDPDIYLTRPMRNPFGETIQVQRPAFQHATGFPLFAMLDRLHTTLNYCKLCDCDENGNLVANRIGGCDEGLAQVCPNWYGCRCVRQQRRPVFVYDQTEQGGILRTLAESHRGWDEAGTSGSGSRSGTSASRSEPALARPRARPWQSEPGLYRPGAGFELSVDRHEVGDSPESYEVEGPSRSRRGNWDWLRRLAPRLGRGAAVWGTRVLDQTLNRSFASLRGGSRGGPYGKGPGGGPYGKGPGGGKGLRVRKRVEDVAPDDTQAHDAGEVVSVGEGSDGR
ncbi:hypothetical protein TWF696_000582 [Orbilia brochopaga]|uniref:Uncharacterized protein n=1 Tax=Orbilia brochopaga TaxID=3140254 RepID=A0AAV9VF87_9PEZI